MAKATTTEPKSASEKPARSQTRAATTKPRAVRNIPKTVVAKTANEPLHDVNLSVSATDDSEPPELSKKELIERIVRDTDMKKGDARRALEAVLGVFRECLAEGTNISAAPLGKIKIARSKETATGQLVVCRIKLKTPVNPDDIDE